MLCLIFVCLVFGSLIIVRGFKSCSRNGFPCSSSLRKELPTFSDPRHRSGSSCEQEKTQYVVIEVIARWCSCRKIAARPFSEVCLLSLEC